MAYNLRKDASYQPSSGTFTLDEIRSGLRKGDLDQHWLAKEQGQSEWVRLGDLEGGILASIQPEKTAEVPSTDGSPESRGSGFPVVARYRDAYRVGAALVGLGNAIKVVGAILAGIIGLGSLSYGNGPFGGGAVVAGIFLAAIVGVLFWVCGVIVAAQGQILRATLDNAVASSHFLTDLERADAMGLPRSIADGGAAKM